MARGAWGPSQSPWVFYSEHLHSAPYPGYAHEEMLGGTEAGLGAHLAQAQEPIATHLSQEYQQELDGTRPVIGWYTPVIPAALEK